LSDAATLTIRAARIDLCGRPLVSRLELTTDAERVALLGDWSALFRLLASEAELAAGSVSVGGHALPGAVSRGAVGVMRVDPLLPPTWSAEQLLATSAELAGATRAGAQKSAFETLERLGLLTMASRRLAHLQLAERRALLVAHAALTDPIVLCLEDPLAGLDSQAEQMLLALIDRASAGRRLVVAVSDPEASAATRRLLSSCEARFGLAAGVAVALPTHHGGVSRVTATVCKNHQAFADALSARGITAHATHEAGLLATLTSPLSGPCWRYLVELPSESTAPVLDAALETDAGLVELIPLYS
jgi:ABC-type cobalamin/Fe3+-siderophores transport system ATPase subunit